MTRHELKTWPEYLPAIFYGTKTYELRREDGRTFAQGDVLVLREWDISRMSEIERRDYAIAHPDPAVWDEDWFRRLEAMGYTGRTCTVEVIGEPLRDTRWLQPGVAALPIRLVA